VERGTRAGGEGACPASGITQSFHRGAQRGSPAETPKLVVVRAEAICATHGHGASSRAAGRDSQAELQEAASSSLLVLLNSLTIPGLTFSTRAASRTDQPSRQTSARPHGFSQPPWSDGAGSNFSLDVVTDACVISLGRSEKYSF